MNAAEHADRTAETQERVRQLVAQERPGGFVTSVLGRDLGL
jgi:hypothetical protein